MCLLHTHPGAVASCSNDGIVNVVNLISEEEILLSAANDVCPMTSVCYHPDTMNLLATSKLGGVHIVNLLESVNRRN